MKILQSVSMLVTLIFLSSGFNNSFAKNIQSGKAFTCSSQADCKRKCEDNGGTWKSDSSGATHGTCTVNNKISSKSNSARGVTSTGTMLVPQSKKPLQLKPVIGNAALPQKATKNPPILKPSITPTITPKVPGFKKPNLPAVSKPTIGIKTAPVIKNISKTPVKLPTGNVKTLKPALVSPTPIGVPVPYPNTSQKGNLQQSPTGQRSGGFVPPEKPSTGGKGFVPKDNVTGGFVAPGLQNNNGGDLQGDDSSGTSFGPGSVSGANNVRASESVEVQPNYREFSQFSVAANSVVATATVVVDDDHRRLTFAWGDGTFEYVTLTGLRSTITAKNRTNDPRKFKFQHIFEAPFDQRFRTAKILARDSNGKGVSESSSQFELDPRYTFILYPVQLEINGHLDSISETHSELYVYMNVMHNDQLIVGREWDESIKTGPGAGEGMLYPVYFSLGEDSRVQLEMSYHRGGPVQVRFDIKEKDNWVKSAWDVITNIPADFDTSNSIVHIPGFHPKDFTGSKEVRAVHTIDDDGTVTAVMSIELNLIVPTTHADEENARFNSSKAR